MQTERCFVLVGISPDILLQEHFLDVLEVKPGCAISVLNTDLKTDFAPAKFGQRQCHAYISEETILPAERKDAVVEGGGSQSSEGVGAGPLVGGFTRTASKEEGVDFKVCPNCRQGQFLHF